MQRPRIALTMGDVAGIGPEIIARVCARAELLRICQPVVVGHPEILRRELSRLQYATDVISLDDWSALDQGGTADQTGIPCLNPGDDEVLGVPLGEVDARSGHGAFVYLESAIEAALAKRIDAIVTAPLNKEALHLAGHHYPGHTEILAEKCGVAEFAMMLYLPPGTRDLRNTSTTGMPASASENKAIDHGLGVAHVTLHTSIASVPGLISETAVAEKIALMQDFLTKLGCGAPRIGVCALNPHGGEHGLFGDEEERLIAPAVAKTQRRGWNVAGPHPADTLFHRAVGGEFDGVIAMYHDQGHIALKLIGFDRAVNVTLGLPIVRTSPSHGTAFDRAGKGLASDAGMLAAIDTAVRLSAR